MPDSYPASMPEFTALDWFNIAGRGRVAVVEIDRERPRSNTGLLDTQVKIDGAIYACVGVEMYALETPLRKGEKIGLLVRPVR